MLSFVQVHMIILCFLEGLVFIYVDDIIITQADSIGIQMFNSLSMLLFNIKDLGRLTQFLVLEIYTSSEGICIAQARLQKSSLVDTSLEINVNYRTDEGELKDPTCYRQLLRSLAYFTIIQLDISYALNFVSQFMTKPPHQHLVVVKRIIRYLLITLIRC